MTLTVLSIIGLFIALRKKKRIYIVFFLIGLVTFLLSFGPDQEIRIGEKLFTITLPYYYLYYVYPLIQIVRVPARFSIFFILSLTVLSSYALSNIKGKKQHIIYGCIFLTFLFEIWQYNTPYVTVPTKDTLPPVYQWLTTTPENAIIVELPVKSIYKGILMEKQLMMPYAQLTEDHVYAMETYRIYFSSFHGKRMLNGYSGFFPTVYNDNVNYLEFFPTPDSMYALKSRHVRYILIHAWQYRKTSWEEIQTNIQTFKELKLIKQFDNDYVYEIMDSV